MWHKTGHLNHNEVALKEKNSLELATNFILHPKDPSSIFFREFKRILTEPYDYHVNN